MNRGVGAPSQPRGSAHCLHLSTGPCDPPPVLGGRERERQLLLDNIPETDEPGLFSHSTDEKTEAQAKVKGMRGHQDQFPIIQMRKLRLGVGMLPNIMADKGPKS